MTSIFNVKTSSKYDVQGPTPRPTPLGRFKRPNITNLDNLVHWSNRNDYRVNNKYFLVVHYCITYICIIRVYIGGPLDVGRFRLKSLISQLQKTSAQGLTLPWTIFAKAVLIRFRVFGQIFVVLVFAVFAVAGAAKIFLIGGVVAAEIGA
jgi:hypothetical protein